MRAVVLEAGAGLSVLAMVVRRSLTSTNERDRNIRSAGECLLTLSACLTQNGLSSFRNFSRMEILPLSCIIWHGYFTLEEEEENIKKGVNIYRLVLCCSVRFLNVVLQKRAVTRLVKELPTCGGVSQDCGIFFGRFSGQQFNSYKKQSET